MWLYSDGPSTPSRRAKRLVVSASNPCSSMSASAARAIRARLSIGVDGLANRHKLFESTAFDSPAVAWKTSGASLICGNKETGLSGRPGSKLSTWLSPLVHHQHVMTVDAFRAIAHHLTSGVPA